MQVLVIARVKAGIEIDRVMPFVSAEAAQVWEFYAAEQIRQVYYILEFRLNATGSVYCIQAVEKYTMDSVIFDLV